ncbi:hypothetical protein Fmac_003480 [Flemingia macrophylla]|uniref:Uncharacterized protein n=1 Tax=Flemingia macrophylla TaxID=520843 RepID=A0ABD1NMW9_9FABA
MALPLLDLSEVLMAKRNKLPRQEAEIFQSCLHKAASDFFAGAFAGGSAVLAATFKLNPLSRLSFSLGAGIFIGSRIFVRSLNSVAEQILKMDGSLLQKELANILATKYQNDLSQMRLMSEHLYLERIFDDSMSNAPKLRWRYRNFFSDNAVQDHHWTHDHESYNNSQACSQIHSNDKSNGKSENVTDSKRTNLETERTFINVGSDVKSDLDPLDYIFDYAPPVEENHHCNSPNKPSGSGILNRAQRRSHRRRRMRNHDGLSNSDTAAAAV